MPKQYLLIGASAASFGAVHSVRRLDPDAAITIISQEHEWPYNKCFLADYLSGSKQEAALSIYQNNYPNLTLILGTRVTHIDTAAKTVTTDKNQIVAYDALFLGMGSSPFIPEIPGISSKGIFTFHTHEDAAAILAFVKTHNVKKIAIIGAGLSGLEAADALMKHQLQVTVIERCDHVLPSMLSKPAADFLHATMECLGIQLMLNASVSECMSSDNKVTGLIVNGNAMPAELVIVATGLRPNIQLCQTAGIKLDDQGVIVNEYLQTTIPDIYAGGDVISVVDQLTGTKVRSCLWPDAMQQGMHAGMAMAGKPKPYAGITMITSTAFFGMKYARAGNLAANSAIIKKGDNFHHSFTLENGALKAFEVLGNQHTLGTLRRLLLTGQPITIDEL